MKISERPEFKSKKPPITFFENDRVIDAVKAMTKDNFGSVVITDKPFLPWQDELVWSDFAIIILPQQIENMYHILNGISDQSYDKMLKTGQALYEDYFTLKGTCRQILKRLIHE